MVGKVLDGKLRWRALIRSKAEVDGLVKDGVDAVVSLEASPVGEELHRTYGERWVNNPIPDPKTAHLPEERFYEAVTRAIPMIEASLERGKAVCVHCLGGTDRSPGLVAAFLRIHGWIREAEEIPLSPRMGDLVEYSVARHCVERLSREFLEAPHRFTSEDSIHSQLFHYLSVSGMSREVRTKAGYMMGTLQHEYPPITPDSGKSRRGLYDLVVFHRDSVSAADHWDHRTDDGTRPGRPLPPLVAVEMGLDKGLTAESAETAARLADFRKELSRISNPLNKIRYGFLVYLYKYAKFHREAMRNILKHIRAEAEESIENTDQRAVIVVAAGYDEEDEFKVIERNELHVTGGVATKAEGPLCH